VDSVQELILRFPSLKVLLKKGKEGCQYISKELNISMGSVTAQNPKILQDYVIKDTTGAGI